MADNKKQPKTLGKVTRGTERALTPSGEEKELSPIEKAIVGGIHDMIEDLRLDEKHQAILNAINSTVIPVNNVVSVLNSINSKMTALLGAIFGYKGINESTNMTTLLGRLGNVDITKTPWASIDSKVQNIIDAITESLSNTRSSRLEDLAEGISAQLSYIIDGLIDNRASSNNESIDKLISHLSNLKESALVNTDADNLNRVYNELQLLSQAIKARPVFDYSESFTNVISKLKDINEAVQKNNVNDSVDLLSGVSSITKILKEYTATNVLNTTESIKQLQKVTTKLSDIYDAISDSSVDYDVADVTSAINEVYKLLSDNYQVNYNSAFTELSAGISNIINKLDELKMENITKNSSTNIVNETAVSNTINDVKNVLNELTSSINTIQNTTVEQLNSSIQELTSYITNSTSITTEVSNISSILSDIKTSIETNTFETINSSLETIATSISNLTNISNVEQISNAISSEIQNMTNALQTIETTNVSNIASSIENLSTSLSSIVETHETYNELTTSISNITNALTSVTEETSNIASSLSSIVTNFNNQETISTVNTISSTLNDIRNALSTNENNTSITEQLTTLSDYITNSSVTNNQTYSELITEIHNLVDNVVSNTDMSSVEYISNNITDNIEQNFVTLGDSINADIAKLSNDIENITVMALDDIKKHMTSTMFSDSRLVATIESLKQSNAENNIEGKVDLNINGLDSQSLESLSKLVSLDYIDSTKIEDINTLILALNSLSTIDTTSLNDLNLDGFVSMFDKLNSITLSDDLKNFASIDLTNLSKNIASIGSVSIPENFNTKGIEGTLSVISRLSNIETKKLNDSMSAILAVDFDKFIDLVNKIEGLTITIENEDEKRISAISDLFSAISNISGFDNKKFSDLTTNLRKMIQLTEKPNLLTTVHLSDRGLIWQLMTNLAKISEQTQTGEVNTKNIGKILQLVTTIGDRLDESKGKQLIKSLQPYMDVTSVESAVGIPAFLRQLNDMQTLLNDPSKSISNETLDKLSLTLAKFNNLNESLSFKDMLMLSAKSSIAMVTSIEFAKLMPVLHELGDFDSNFNLDKFTESISKLSTINVQKVENLVSIIQSIQTVSSISKKIDSIKNVLGVVSELRQLSSNLNGIKIEDNSKNIELLCSVIGSIYESANIINSYKSNIDTENLDNLINTIIEIDSRLSSITVNSTAVDISGLTATLANLAAVSSIISSNKFDSVDVESVIRYIDELKTLVNVLNDSKDEITIDASIDLAKLESSVVGLKGTVAALATISVLGLPALAGAWMLRGVMPALTEVVNSINKINLDRNAEDKLKNLGVIIATSSLILLFAAATGAYVLAHFFEVIGFSLALGTFILSVIGATNIATKSLDDSFDNVDQIAKLVAYSGAIMLLGGSIMTLWPELIVGALEFGVALGVFILSTVGALAIGSKLIDDSIDAANDLVQLVAISAGVMLFGGGLFYMYPWLIATTLLFGAELAAFIGAVTFAYNYTGGLDDAIKNADKFATLIAISAACLLVGGLVFKENPWMIVTSLLFGAMLVAFVGAITFAYNYTGGLDDAIKNADKFGVLVGISALSMMLGGYLFQENPWMILTTLLFAAELAAFVGAVTFTYAFASKFIDSEIKTVEKFGFIVALSALTMLVGGAFMKIPGMPLATFEFVGLLALFVGLTIGTYVLASKSIQNAQRVATEFGVIVGLSAIALLIGGGLFLAYPGLFTSTMLFATATAVFIGIMGTAIWLLGKIDQAQLIAGELALAGIVVIIGLTGVAMYAMAEAANNVNDIGKLWTTIGAGFAMIIAYAIFVGGLVALTTITGGIGAGVIAAAEGLLAGLIGCIWLTGQAISAIAQSMLDLDKAKNIDFDAVSQAIGSYVSMVPLFAPLANPIVMAEMNAARVSIYAMSAAISDIAGAVKEISALNIPIYGNDGKIVGYRKLTKTDFENAAANTKEIVSTLGKAIIELYQENPDIFGLSTFESLFHVDTPFARVAKSCRTMGAMISDIASGVKEMAVLRIPIYEGTQVVGYRSLDKTDFENAANNTKMIISTLGGAIMSLYKGPVYDINGNKIADSGSEMFGWQLIGDNPFASTVKSTSMLGKLISDIASGVKNVAQLNIAEYDAQGNITGYRPMNDDDFTNAAKNTEVILTTLASAIIQTYENNPDMFTDPSMWHTDADKTPFGMAVKSLAGIGDLISSAVKGIQDIAKLEVDFSPLEGKNGKVAKIITVLAEGIMEAYKEHEDWFTDDSFWHTDPQKTPFGMVMQSMNGVTKFIETVAKAIDDINKLDFAAQDVAVGGEIYNKVNRIVSVVPKAVIDLMRDKVYGKYLMDDDYIETYEDINSMYSYFVKIINNGVKAYELVAKMEIPESANIEERVSTILKSIPKAIIDEYTRNSQYYTSENKVFKVMEDSFERYKSLISYIVDTYKNTFNRLNDIGAVTDESVISNISSRITKMIVDMGSSVNLMTNSLNLENVKLFSETVSIYKDGLRSLIKAISMVPEDLKEYDNVLNAISSINIKVAEIPALTNFRDEQEILSDYIQTLNSLDVTNVNALTELMSTMNQLSTNLGSLDKFTDTLANRVAEVLSNLTQQIQVSGNIINKAEELQERRHRAINDSISKLREFMEKPMNINVTHTEGQVSDVDFSGSVADYGPSAPSYPAAPTPQPVTTTGGIDYTKLRNTIVGAILATRQDNSQFNNSRY